MIVKDTGGGTFEQAPAGTHIARCIKLIDIGTHTNEYQGQTNVRRQVIIGWELPEELLQTGDYAGQPFALSRFYTMSLSEKANLRKDLAAWRGRDFTTEELAGFDLKNILGAPCMLSVIHNEQDRAKVNSVMALPKKTKAPKQVNETVYFSLEPEEFDQSMFDSFSKKMQAMIADSPEYELIKSTPVMEEFPRDDETPWDDDDSSIPF